MLDKIQSSIKEPHRQRVLARASASFIHKGGRTALSRLSQVGSAKAMLPKVHRPEPEVVFLNTAGGLTGGDRIEFSLNLEQETKVVGTTQTAERAYASLPNLPPAQLDLRIRVGAGARLDWLPQETILFDKAKLHRRTEIALEGDAECLWCETVVLGREAMGETIETLDFRDTRLILRGGKPVMAEPVRLDTDILSGRNDLAGLAGARAIATVALVSATAPELAPRLRPFCERPGIRAAVSGWDGKLLLRGHSSSPQRLRQWLAELLTELRGGPLPRVWMI